MHRAPAVNFSVKRSRWHARLVACMTALSAAALLAFVLGQEILGLDLRVLLLATGILATSGFALAGWKRSPQGTLRWDGQHWFWSDFASNPVCCLRLLMDLQRVVLVSIAADAYAPVYLWLEEMPGDAYWKPLRRAIVSSQAGADGTGKRAPLPPEVDLL
jgi:hypothetical protein